jgi:hypothetical protein
LSDIFTEVDEDLRRERALKLWNKYGNYVIGAALLIVGGTAANVAWKDYQHRQEEAAAAQYVAAIDQAKSGDAATAGLALAGIARDGKAGYSVLARFEDAALKSRQGDPAGAAAIYRAIADDSTADRALRDAAAVLAGLASSGGADAAESNRQLAGLTAPNSPWRHLAWEIEALAAAKAGKMDEARSLYARIADDPDAPSGARTRAAEMLAALEG